MSLNEVNINLKDDETVVGSHMDGEYPNRRLTITTSKGRVIELREKWGNCRSYWALDDLQHR